jgi:hypothetical protein
VKRKLVPHSKIIGIPPGPILEKPGLVLFRRVLKLCWTAGNPYNPLILGTGTSCCSSHAFSEWVTGILTDRKTDIMLPMPSVLIGIGHNTCGQAPLRETPNPKFPPLDSYSSHELQWACNNVGKQWVTHPQTNYFGDKSEGRCLCQCVKHLCPYLDCEWSIKDRAGWGQVYKVLIILCCHWVTGQQENLGLYLVLVC